MVPMTSGSSPAAGPGFDVVLLGCLAVTAWGLWKQRQIVVPASIITSVLLLCDAWFDLLTANGHRDLIVSAASALFGELPLATMLILISIRALHVGARAARALELDARVSSLWRTPLITFPGPRCGNRMTVRYRRQPYNKRRATPLAALLATGWSHAQGGKPLNWSHAAGG